MRANPYPPADGSEEEKLERIERIRNQYTPGF
jgi:hypothetical protein